MSGTGVPGNVGETMCPHLVRTGVLVSSSVTSGSRKVRG